MHEVGHTLGLRHNFKASAWKDLKQIDDKSKGPSEAIVASVMDYNPANIAPSGNVTRATTTRPRSARTTTGPSNTATKKSPAASPRNWTKSPPAAPSRLCNTRPTRTSSSAATRWTNLFDLGHNPIEFAIAADEAHPPN